MEYGDLSRIVGELEEKDEFPITKKELANKFRQYDCGDVPPDVVTSEDIAERLEQSNKEEFGSPVEIGSWIDEHYATGSS